MSSVIRHVVMMSGGIGSWATAKRVVDEHGPDEVVLLFADTKVEDPDVYRFLHDAVAQLGARLVTVADGRTPWEVFKDRRIIGNSRIAPCSQYLKQIPCRRWLEENTDPVLCAVYVGIDWSESHRLPAIQKAYQPWTALAPLCEPPYLDKEDLIRGAEARGLKPPRMYEQGFPHANCGGACVRAGQAQWALLHDINPARYAEEERQEQQMRAHLGKDVAILREHIDGISRPLPLTVLRTRITGGQTDRDDWGGCGCFTEPQPAPDTTPAPQQEGSTPVTSQPVDDTTDLWAGLAHLEPPNEPLRPMWDEPVPLNPRRELPTFPVHALPDWLGGMVAGVAEETQTPVDLAGCLALAVLATAAGGRAAVHVRGHWREPVNLYTAVALPPGNRKSAVFALMTGPLLAAEKALVELSGPRRAEAETTARLARSAADKAAQKAAAAEPGLRDQLTAEAVHLAQQADEMTVPAKPQLVADDVTPESLATLVADQDGRMSVMSAEGEIFDIIAGRYSGTPNMGIFLKGHAGDMVRVNRQGRDAQHVEAPAITMGLAIQPEVLDALGRVKGADGRGLLARFLYAKPLSLVGSRNLTPDLLPEETAATYAKQLGGLTLALADWTDPAVLNLTPDADAVLLAYQKVTESRIGKGRSLHPVIKWASKRDGAVARIAGLLHLATHPDNGWMVPIEAATVANAVEIGDYFTAHALEVFDAMGADPAQEAAHQLLAHLKEQRLSGFTKRELFRGLSRGDFPAMTDLDPALTLLEEHGWVRQQPAPPRTGRGGRPPSPRFDTHPAVTPPLTTG